MITVPRFSALMVVAGLAYSVSATPATTVISPEIKLNAGLPSVSESDLSTRTFSTSDGQVCVLASEGFAIKALSVFSRLGEFLLKNLDGHLAPHFGILGEVHRAHGAAA